MRKYRLFHLYSHKVLFVSRETFFDKVVLYSCELCLPSFQACAWRAPSLCLQGVFRSSCGDWICYPDFIPASGCLPFVFLHFSRLFVCSGDFYRDFYVFSSFTFQKSVLLRTFAKKKRSFFRSLKILFLPDAIKKTRFPTHDHPIYIRFFFRFIVFWYLYLCPGDFAGVFCRIQEVLGDIFLLFRNVFSQQWRSGDFSAISGGL